jgi:hypothetical protein
MGNIRVEGNLPPPPSPENLFAPLPPSASPPGIDEYTMLQSALFNTLNINNFSRSSDDQSYSTTLGNIYYFQKLVDPERFESFHQALLNGDQVKLDKQAAQDAQDGKPYGLLQQLANNMRTIERMGHPSTPEKLDELVQSYNSLLEIAQKLPGNAKPPENSIVSFFLPRMKDLETQLINDRNKLIDPIEYIKECNKSVGWDHQYTFPPDRADKAVNILQITKQMSDDTVELQNYMNIMPKKYQDEFASFFSDFSLKDIKDSLDSLYKFASSEVTRSNNGKYLSELSPSEYEGAPNLRNDEWDTRSKNISDRVDILAQFDFNQWS